MSVEGTQTGSSIREAMATAQQRQQSRQGGGSGNGGGNNNNGGNDSGDKGSSRRDDAGSNKNRYASLSQIGRINPTPIAMSGTAEALETFRRDFVEAMPEKDDNNMLNVNVIPIDAGTSGIPFSLLIVAATRRGKEALGVGYHTFLLEASAEALRPFEDTHRQSGHRVKIVQVPGDGYDSRTRDVVKEVLGRQFPGKALLSADAEVVANGFPSIKDDETAIADCVKNSFAAIKTAIDRADPQAPALCLTAEDDDTFNTIHVQHRQNHIFDRGHMPVRADVIIDLQSRVNKGRNSRDPLEQLVTGTRISRLGGYYDVVYAPGEGAVNRNDLYRNERDDRRRERDEAQLYALRFITTFVDTVDFSPTTMLLAQATMNAAGDTNEIMRAFEPNQSIGEDDMRNIGALAIEPNLLDLERGFGERYDTKTSSFTTAKRQALLRTVLRPGIFYSIDVPECAAATWQHIDMLAASQGNTAALNRIYDAAAILTDGHIEDVWRRGDAIIDPHVERIHAGYFTEGNGTQRLDLRALDYIALLNLLRPEKEEDMMTIQRWSMAASTMEDTILSQSDRYEIIRDFMPTAVITGFHQRFNYSLDWNEALVEAINRCKLSLNPSSSGRDGNERFRTTYGNIDQLLSRGGSNGLYRNQRQGRDRNEDRYSDRSEERNGGRW